MQTAAPAPRLGVPTLGYTGSSWTCGLVALWPRGLVAPWLRDLPSGCTPSSLCRPSLVSSAPRKSSCQKSRRSFRPARPRPPLPPRLSPGVDAQQPESEPNWQYWVFHIYRRGSLVVCPFFSIGYTLSRLRHIKQNNVKTTKTFLFSCMPNTALRLM